MIVYKCKMCGGNLNIQEGEKTAVCEYCRTQQTVPSTDDEKRANLFNRANHYRQNCEFDKALAIYEHILDEDSNDAEAYWSIVLCRYGIEYVEDPATKERKPTINRMQAQSILQDADYQMALEHADYTQKNLYEKEATEIDRIQKEILRIAQKEEPYDIFISYKEKASNGERTKSSVLAQDVYNHLTKEGYRVFFSRISLEDKLGQKYEPYIYSALNSSKIMLVIGTERDEFVAPWVKNEWSRFLAMMRENSEKLLIPCFRDITIDELPDEFQILQSQDMGRIGFEQDLLRGIEKVVRQKKEESTISGKTVYENNQSLDRLLQNAETYMKLCNYKEAIEVYNKIIKLYPEDYRGWWGMMISNSNNFMVREYDSGFEARMNEWFSYFRQLVSTEEYEKGKQQYEEYKKTLSKVQTRYEIEEVKNIMAMHENTIDELKKKKDSIDQDRMRENATHNRALKEINSKISEKNYNISDCNEKILKEKRSCTISCVALVIFLIIGIYLCSLGSAAICLGLFVLTFDFGSAIPMIMVKNRNINDLQGEKEKAYQAISEQEKTEQTLRRKHEAAMTVNMESSMGTENKIKVQQTIIEQCQNYMNKENEIQQFLFACECRKAGITKEIDSEFADLRNKILTDNATK